MNLVCPNILSASQNQYDGAYLVLWPYGSGEPAPQNRTDASFEQQGGHVGQRVSPDPPFMAAREALEHYIDAFAV